MLSPSKPKPINSIKRIKTEWLIFKEKRECAFPALTVSTKLSSSASSFLGATPLGECCISVSSLALSSGTRDTRWRSILSISTTFPFAFTLPSTEFLLNLCCSCSVFCLSIVVSRPKSLERTSSRRRLPLRATIVAKARHSSRTLVATSINNRKKLVATKHSALRDRLCPPCQFVSWQASWLIALRTTAFENRSSIRSNSCARNSSAPKRSKLLPSRHSSKWRLLAASWSRQLATARLTTSMLHPTVNNFCTRLHMRQAFLRWLLPLATRVPMRDR